LFAYAGLIRDARQQQQQLKSTSLRAKQVKRQFAKAKTYSPIEPNKGSLGTEDSAEGKRKGSLRFERIKAIDVEKRDLALAPTREYCLA